MDGKNKFNIALVLAIIIFTGITTSTPVHAEEMGDYYHKGNAMSAYFDSGSEAINGWSTVVMTTSSFMDSNKRKGNTAIQAWARLDTVKAQYPLYMPTVQAVETKMKTTTADSNKAFYLLQTNPGHKVSRYSVNTFIFDLLDYKIPGVGLVGKLAENYANGLTTGTQQDFSNPKNGTLTFLSPTNASLSNTISWKDANKAIGPRKNSGVAVEFHFDVADGVKINVAPQARVQYGLYTSSSIIPMKIWTNYAYVNHTLN